MPTNRTYLGCCNNRLFRSGAGFLMAAIAALGTAPDARAQETIGGGTLASPATGPAPTYNIGGSGMVLVKNWNFGTNGTVRNITDLSTHFQYHDQFGTIANGTNYGAVIVAPDSANAISGQPIQDPNNPVRGFLADSLRTYLVPLNGATTVDPDLHNAGCGSFQAKWKLPYGGSLLNQDIVWETRVRYVTPRYFWFAIWTAGNEWNGGAEMDVVESFGYNNGGGYTNYDGRYWHSNSVGGSDTTNYSIWGTGMSSRGITSFDATQYHIWTWHYRKDNTYSVYVDGIEVQSGTLNWTLTGVAGRKMIDMSFIFDAGWGHTQVASVNSPMPASEFVGKYYEWDYSRVYLSQPAPSVTVDNPSATLSAGWQTSTAMTGQYYGANYIHDNNGSDTKTARYTPTIPSAGLYNVYAMWNGSGSDRATNVTYSITHTGGTSNVTKNQNDPGQWSLLGTYSFNAGTAGNVLISTAGANNYVIADAVRFTKVIPAEIVMDSENTSGVTRTGTWTSSTTNPGYLGSNYLHDGNTAKGSKSVRFTPPLASNGTYQIFLRWTSGTNRASNVPVDIVRADGTTATITVDQRSNGGTWYSIGTYSLSTSNAAVTLRTTGTYIDSVNGYVIADSIKFVPQ